MESIEMSSLLDRIDDEIDELDDALSLVLGTSFITISSKLPVLDKAKLFALVTYAIESIIFSYLKLNGTDAREHAVFKELTRVRHYFEKIKSAESPAEQPTVGLDKEAAKRFINSSLRGNHTMDLNVASTQVGETTAHISYCEDDFNGRPPQNAAISDESKESDSAPTSEEGESSVTHAQYKISKAESMIESKSVS